MDARGLLRHRAAVIAIIARSMVKLTRSTLGRDRLLWGVGATAAVVTAWTESEIAWVFVGAGVLAMLVRTRARRLPEPVLIAFAGALEVLLKAG